MDSRKLVASIAATASMLAKAAAVPVHSPDVDPRDAFEAVVAPTPYAPLPLAELMDLRTRVRRARHAMAAAALHGHVHGLRALLATGIRPTETALLNAVIAGRREAASVLLWRGDDPNALPSATAPLWAFCQGDCAMITLLSSRGVNLEARWVDDGGSTALVRAALHSSRRYVVALLRCGASVANFKRDLAVVGGPSSAIAEILAQAQGGTNAVLLLCGVGDGAALRTHRLYSGEGRGSGALGAV